MLFQAIVKIFLSPLAAIVPSSPHVNQKNLIFLFQFFFLLVNLLFSKASLKFIFSSPPPNSSSLRNFLWGHLPKNIVRLLILLETDEIFTCERWSRRKSCQKWIALKKLLLLLICCYIFVALRLINNRQRCLQYLFAFITVSNDNLDPLSL